jgi:flavin-dependent dehydrogenase
MADHSSRIIERHCDVAVVGGSAAGLAAALQLGRQRRSVIVVHAGEPRNAPAAHMHGNLGHEGLPPADLLALAREEVRSYGDEVVDRRAVDITPPPATGSVSSSRASMRSSPDAPSRVIRRGRSRSRRLGRGRPALRRTTTSTTSCSAPGAHT